jgi:DNA-binding CsgD family transcriptional regulator
VDYNYDFTSGGIIKVDVDQQWIDIMEGMDRAEHANDEYNRRLYLKLSHGNQHEPEPCEIVCRAESMMELMKKLEKLTNRQRDVLRKRMSGIRSSDIAKGDGVSRAAIHYVLAQIQNKFQIDT